MMIRLTCVLCILTLVVSVRKSCAEPERYVVAPIKQKIGFTGKRPSPNAVIAEGIDTVLERAINDGVGYAVFEIDGGMGDASEALLIADVILKHNENIETVAVIRECKGSSLLIAMACERWFVLPKGRRAALAIELDEQNPSPSSELARIAKATGRSPELALSLSQPSAVLYAQPQDNAPHLLSAEPVGVALDESVESTLSLRADQLIELGLAGEGRRTRELWEAVGLPEPWERDGKPNQGIGPETVREIINAERERSERFDEIIDGFDEIDRRAKDAMWNYDRATEAPYFRVGEDVYVDPYSKKMTRSEKILKNEGLIRSALSAWNRAHKRIEFAIESVERATEATELAAELEPSRHFQHKAESEAKRVASLVERISQWDAVLKPKLARCDQEVSHYIGLLSEVGRYP